MRYLVKLSYCGAGFNGWQFQPDAPSVQESLEEALKKLTGSTVKVTGAGRTDTGVNARGYVAHFDVPAELDCGRFRYKLNAILPQGVSVEEISPSGENFHARFDASRREYTYFLHRIKDPFLADRSYCFTYPDLDVDAMNRAAALLLGTHDFSCFEKTGGDNRTSVCTVFEAGWHRYTPAPSVESTVPADSEPSGNYLYFKISADRFLRNMVRAVVGTLLEVGRGRRSVESVSALLTSGGRSDAGQSVPGHALFLSRIDYPNT